MKHKYIGYLKVGNVIRTEKDGKPITVEITDIRLDPTDSFSGVLIYINHTDTSGNTEASCIGLSNLQAWFDGQTEWTLDKRAEEA